MVEMVGAVAAQWCRATEWRSRCVSCVVERPKLFLHSPKGAGSFCGEGERHVGRARPGPGRGRETSFLRPPRLCARPFTLHALECRREGGVAQDPVAIWVPSLALPTRGHTALRSLRRFQCRRQVCGWAQDGQGTGCSRVGLPCPWGPTVLRGFCGEGAASPKVGWETRKSSPSPFVPPNPWASSSPPSQGVLKPLQPTLPAPTVKSP